MMATSDLMARLLRDGYAVVELNQPKIISEMQNLVKKSMNLGEFTDRTLSFDSYAEKVKTAIDDMAKSELVKRLLEKQKDLITNLCGPDVDYQWYPHIRVSRPDAKTDTSGWHRDTFYGNSPYEVNWWFPVFDLPQGSGLRFLPGSHRMPSKNVRPAAIPEDIAKDRTVARGSVANQIGFLYQPQMDDTIAGMKQGDDVLVAPKVGEAIVFLASLLHAGSTGTNTNQPRISIDIRVRNCHAPTSTKPGFYVPLFRGLVSECANQFLGH
jgi:hypothetical protein